MDIIRYASSGNIAQREQVIDTEAAREREDTAATMRGLGVPAFMLPPAPSDGNGANSRIGKPPPSLMGTVSVADADGARQAVLGAGAGPGRFVPTKEQFETMPPMALLMYAMRTMSTALLTVSDMKVKQAAVNTESENKMAVERTKNLRDQITQQIADAAKAHKGGIWGAITDFIVGIAEAVSGVAKILAFDYAGGVADLVAGVAGIIKASAESALLANPNDKDAQKLLEVFSKVQMIAESIGAAVDLLSMGRGMVASSAVEKASGTVMAREGVNGGKTAFQEIAGEMRGLAEAITQNVEQNVLKEMEQQIAKTITAKSEQMGKWIADEAEAIGGEALFQTMNVSKDKVAQLASKEIEKLLQNGLKEVESVVASGTSLETLFGKMATDLETKAGGSIRGEVQEVIADATLKNTKNQIKAAVVHGAGFGNQLVQGAIGLERAGMRELVAKLQALMEFSQAMSDEIEGQNKPLTDQAKQSMKSRNSVQTSTNQTMVTLMDAYRQAA